MMRFVCADRAGRGRVQATVSVFEDFKAVVRSLMEVYSTLIC